MSKGVPRPTSSSDASAGGESEIARLLADADRRANWKRWGPYLAERQWGTVREDYSPDGSCWSSFSHDQARSRAYRWGEDGLLGWTDRQCRLCLGVALWNGRDPILKERLFGLTNDEGNHGEDVKEHFFYLDSTPTHGYARAVYFYPHEAYPYERLVRENRSRAERGRAEPEFELDDTGVFDAQRYFEIQVEYAKGGEDDTFMRITATNRASDGPSRELHVVPSLWFRNTWSWGCTHEGCEIKPRLSLGGSSRGSASVRVEHPSLGAMSAHACEPAEWLFTENETNFRAVFGFDSGGRFTKDAFHRRIIGGDAGATNPAQVGTKAGAWHRVTLMPGQSKVVRLWVGRGNATFTPAEFDQRVASQAKQADAFYADVGIDRLPPAERPIARQAFAGLLWSKQFYHYSVKDWLDGDPDQPVPPASRQTGRNADWRHLFNRDVLSVPDKWEYPWYASWDLAFHTVAYAAIDPAFAKEQLLLLLREWYMHPSGQIPAYEFNFSDVNPPVHAWACWRVYQLTGCGPHRSGPKDRAFLARAFHKLLINFTWWVNRKDPQGRHLFAGGFLGLDNIGVFDRSRPLPGGGTLEQADGTAWMAFFCGTMLSMALELAKDDPTYEDIASKFFEHFIAIVDAMNAIGGRGLWDDGDGFYYDQLSPSDGSPARPIRVRSLVGIIPILACEVLEQDVIDRLPGFRRRMEWFIANRPDLARHISCMSSLDGTLASAGHDHRLLAIPSRERLQRVLSVLLDEREFLSPFGVRSLSKLHASKPYVLAVDGQEYRVDYSPGESTTSLFGGNSNWRGPIWMPLNYLIIEALERYHHYFGEAFHVECPTGSGHIVTLAEAADELRRRLISLWLPDERGVRPCAAGVPTLAQGAARDYLLFHEHFHGDTGRGLGASHQTGWTALIALIIMQYRGVCGRG